MAAYTVSLKAQPTAPVTVALTSDDPTVATVGSTDGNDWLIFGAGNWNIPQTVTVTGVDDDLDNPQNRRATTIRHEATGGGFDNVAISPVSVTVTDDDPGDTTPGQPPGVTVSRSQLLVAEDGGQGTYTVSLNGEPSEAVVITAASSNDGAAKLQAGQGAAGAEVTLRFTTADWSDPQTVTVIGQDDDVDNPGDQRLATITHTATGGRYNGEDVGNPITVTVVDDDQATTVGGDYGVTLSRTAVGMMEGAQASYSIALNAKPLGPVLVSLSSSDDSVAEVTPVALLFAASDWQTPQMVTVTGVDDPMVGGERTATISHTISGGGYGNVTIPDVAVTVGDDDVRQVVVSRTALEVAEAGGKASYTLMLTSPPDDTGPVQVTLNTEGPVEVSPPQAEFTASNWDVPQTVTVTGVNDDKDNPEDRRMATITHSLSGGGYGSVVADGVTVTVTDDDAFGLTISKTELHVPPGASATYEVTLNSTPRSPVTVIVENGNNRLFVSADGTQYQSGLPAELVFNSKGTKTVEVTNDGFRGTHTLRHRTISNDANYGDKKWADVVVHAARKATVTPSAPDKLFVGDSGVITATIDEPALLYDLKVNLSIPDKEGRDLLGLAENTTITIKAGALSGEKPFTIATGPVERPDYRCNGGRSSAYVWISSSNNYNSFPDVFTPVIIRVLHGDFKAGGRCEGN